MTDISAMWAQRSLERARRWIERLDTLTQEAFGKVSEAQRKEIEDFTAACDGELMEIPYKVNEQLSYEYAQLSLPDSEERAKQWVGEWMTDRVLLKGLSAVRHVDVHFEGRRSGRRIVDVVGISHREWWTHPGVHEPWNSRLYPSNRLSDSELADFNDRLLNTALVDVLRDAANQVGELLESASEEVTFIRECFMRLVYHEVGHAVAAIVLGSDVSEIALGDFGRADGLTGGGFPDSMPYEEAKRRMVIIAAAGGAAEELAFSGTRVDFNSAEFGGDRDLIAELTDCEPSDLDAAIQGAVDAAIEILQAKWHAVEILVPLFMEERSLSGSRIREVLSSSAES